MEHMDHKLDCKDCGTIYLNLPGNLTNDTPIFCSTCNQFIGRWGDLERDFNAQGGQNGVFELHDGQIDRKS